MTFPKASEMAEMAEVAVTWAIAGLFGGLGAALWATLAFAAPSYQPEGRPAANTAPTAFDQTVATTADGPVSIVLTGSDPDTGDTLALIIVSLPRSGDLSEGMTNITTGDHILSGDVVTYTPDTGFSGTDGFTFKVNDGIAESFLAAVSVNVSPASSFTVELALGINLVSIPAPLVDPSLNGVFGDVSEVNLVFTYDRFNPRGPWLVAFRFGPDTGFQGELQVIEPGLAYWVRAINPTTVTLQLEEGAELPSYELGRGWSLIGYIDPNVPSMAVGQYLGSLQGLWQAVYTYEHGEGGTCLQQPVWNRAVPGYGFQDMEAGKGYWIWLAANATLSVGGIVGAGSLEGSVVLPGRPDRSGVRVALNTGEDSITDSSGQFKFSGLPQGTYIATAGAPRGYLDAVASHLPVISGDTLQVSITLPGGDVNDDGRVNVQDLRLMAASLGTTSEQADITANGVVDILDIAVAAVSLGKASPGDSSSPIPSLPDGPLVPSPSAATTSILPGPQWRSPTDRGLHALLPTTSEPIAGPPQLQVCPGQDQAVVRSDPFLITVIANEPVTVLKAVLDEGTGDAVDLLPLMAAFDDIRFTFIIPGLSLGTHDFSVKVQDTEGSVAEASRRFQVIERPPFTIQLHQGWNMVSVPGSPVDRRLDSIFGDPSVQGLISRVCSWDPTDGWLCSDYNEESETWLGPLKGVRSGNGYLVNALDAVTLNVDIPIPDPLTLFIPPTIPVKRGWNLIGVSRLAEKNNMPAREYLGFTAKYTSGVLFHFDAAQGQWVELGLDDEVEAGKSYWVWFQGDVLLTP